MPDALPLVRRAWALTWRWSQGAKPGAAPLQKGADEG
jgi:hypothetical protein